ncbi:hypothetical protein [Nakamurella aerolata]|uniref:Uncharacterized protein n=1 Tax=Nakamurella aerolata TaxID=1656892 RepID=A0A849AFH7_9ACTN|nr:hypothetical protein [Nakamurella aerolata]NNG35592.1 hypothetical protein [Nakamurella aerolata]
MAMLVVDRIVMFMVMSIASTALFQQRTAGVAQGREPVVAVSRYGGGRRRRCRCILKRS